MAKKYLNLDEAAQMLGMAPDELVRFRDLLGRHLRRNAVGVLHRLVPALSLRWREALGGECEPLVRLDEIRRDFEPG